MQLSFSVLEMKVIQLANFKPRFELKYDEEIEEYRQKLEDSYQLCQECQRHLKKTLNRVKTKFIGSKISQMVKKGIQIVGSSKPVAKDRQIISKLVMMIILVLSIVNFVKDLNINLDFLRTYSNATMTSIYFHLVALRLTVVELLRRLIKELEFDNLVDFNNMDSIAISAVALNFIVLLRQKKVRLPIIASMLFWSLKMILVEIPMEPTRVFQAKSITSVVLVITSVVMLYKSNKVNKPIVDKNGSFHKIHNEINEESDNELDLTDSSCNDARSIRSSIVYAPSFNSSIRQRTLIEPAKTFANSTLHNSTFGRQDARSVGALDLLSNRSFSIRQEVSAADRSHVNKGINKLNISGGLHGSTSTLKNANFTSKNLNPFSLENSRCGSPTPSFASVFSGSYRSQMISPPRLEPTFVGEANTSWVAGGYWSSPQKRYLEANHFKQHPEMSRSSSQSSGLGTIDGDKNSRENSIGNDDVTSFFSEPVRRLNLFEKPSEVRSLFGGQSRQSFVQAPKGNNFLLGPTGNNFRKYRETNSTFFK